MMIADDVVADKKAIEPVIKKEVKSPLNKHQSSYDMTGMIEPLPLLSAGTY